MSHADFLEFRRSLGQTPALHRMSARVRGVELAVWTSPPVPTRLRCSWHRQLYPSALEQPDLEVHGAYSRASYAAWFADAELAAHFVPPVAASVTGAAVAARLRREGYDWHEPLRALSTPALVLHGQEDALPATVATELSQLLPRARLVLIPRARHMPFWEAPRRFFSEVDAFLATGAPALSRPT